MNNVVNFKKDTVATIRVNSEVGKEPENLGLILTDAINAFSPQSLNTDKFPFSVTEDNENKMTEMFLS